jgi:hypothetical protein
MKRKLPVLLFLIFLSACERSNDLTEILKYYGDAKEDIGYSIAIADDGYYLAGDRSIIIRNGTQIISFSKKPAIIKTGFDGNLIWERTFAGRLTGYLSKVIVLSDGSVAATGQVTDSVALTSDILTVKINSDGTGPVDSVYKLTGNQAGRDLLQTSEGFMILGTTDVARPVTSESVGNNAGKLDIMLMRTGNSLTRLDPNPPVWGFPENDQGVAIKAADGGGFIIAGSTERYKLEGHKHDLFLLKTNYLGAETGYVIIGGTDDEYAADFEPYNDGFVVAGNIGASSETQSVFVKKISLSLDSVPLFSSTIVRSGSWSVNAVSRYKSSSLVLAGMEGTSSQSKFLVLAVDAGGNQIEGKEKILGNTGIQVAYDVATDSENNIIAVGKNTFESNSLITLLKFSF